jgi:cytochrome c oxidase assembly protein subunit 15
MNWLYIFAFLVAVLVVFGGFVRLTRSGLSIVEWNPISGTLPPIGAQAWAQEFAKYQQTPEYKIINSQMTLAEYEYIFIIEWIHRFLARLVGLVYAVPVFYFLFKRIIPFKEFGVYFAIGLLFIAQAFMGWYMVASGLVDRPEVSHIRLTIHLLFALSLLGFSLWIALGHREGFVKMSLILRGPAVNRWAALALLILVLQITLGGLSAGLKAGNVSDTWPLMYGALIPTGIFDRIQNILWSPQIVAFVHRWFAWLGLILVPLVYTMVLKVSKLEGLGTILLVLTGLVLLQIVLGILVVLLHVPLAVALIHQANALALFILGIILIHRLGVVSAR